MFRRFFLCAGLGVLVTGCLDQSSRKHPEGPVYRHHFVGAAAANKSTNATKLKEVMALPASSELRSFVLEKLAKAPLEVLGAPKNAPDTTELLRPLLHDLMQQESYVEVRGAIALEGVMAVHLDDARKRLWHTNLSKALMSWKQGTPAEVTVGTNKGWQITRNRTPKNIQFFRAGQWVVLGVGDGDLSLTAAALERIGRTGRAVPTLTNDWLELTLDLPAIQRTFPAIAQQQLPRAHLTVRGAGEGLRTGGVLAYPETLKWKHEPWKIPMKTATEPLISFTVARGIAPILKNSPAFRQLGLKEVPNQYCLWGQQHDYSLTFLAVPVSNATNVINQLANTLPRVAQQYMPNHFGDFLWVSNRAEVIWQGLPFIVPRLQPVHEQGTDFVYASMFPKWPNTNPPPAELLDQFMNRSNVVYYDWEITPERIKHGNQLLQLYNIANNLRLPGTNLPTQAWVQSAGPLLGNTVTELSVTNSHELAVLRRSVLGLTGFEIAALLRWVESPGFPLRYEPPASLRGARLGASSTNAPSSNAPTAGTNSARSVPPQPTPPR